MNIDTIKTLLNNKLTSLQNRLNSATLNGEIEEVISIELEIEETTDALTKLNSL